MNHNKRHDSFLELTWFDLESFFGGKILSRGRTLQKSGAVQRLATVGMDALVADVQGSRLYTTKVSIDKGILTSVCTCPFGISCKHGAALVIEYLESIKAGEKLPSAESEDYRLERPAVFDPTEEDVFDEEPEAMLDVADGSKPVRLEKEDTVLAQLRKKSKEELFDILTEVLRRCPDFRSELNFQIKLKKAPAPALVKSVKQEIAKATREPGWWDAWNHRGYIPDFSKVTAGLQSLLDAGQADNVVKLGEFLWKEGIALVEQSNDEGETLGQVAEAMHVVIRGLLACSMFDIEKMERAVHWELEDEYGLCEGLKEFWQHDFPKQSYDLLVERLKERLDKIKPANKEDDWCAFSNRHHLTDILVRALDKAGRSSELQALCEKEATKTGDYERLINFLKKEKRFDEAEEWIRKALAKAPAGHHHANYNLRGNLREVRTMKDDWPFVAAMRAEDFFLTPDIESFRELREATERCKSWKNVKPLAMRFLETGEIPAPGQNGWPLPDTGLNARPAKPQGKPPFAETLLEIALHEEKPKEALHWFEAVKKKCHLYFGEDLFDRTAISISKEYPDKAVEIWKRLAEKQIAQTNVAGYYGAASYLRKAMGVMQKEKRNKEWEAYLQKIKTTKEYKRKRRLMEILERLDERPIVEMGRKRQ